MLAPVSGPEVPAWGLWGEKFVLDFGDMVGQYISFMFPFIEGGDFPLNHDGRNGRSLGTPERRSLPLTGHFRMKLQKCGSQDREAVEKLTSSANATTSWLWEHYEGWNWWKTPWALWSRRTVFIDCGCCQLFGWHVTCAQKCPLLGLSHAMRCPSSCADCWALAAGVRVRKWISAWA